MNQLLWLFILLPCFWCCSCICGSAWQFLDNQYEFWYFGPGDANIVPIKQMKWKLHESHICFIIPALIKFLQTVLSLHEDFAMLEDLSQWNISWTWGCWCVHVYISMQKEMPVYGTCFLLKIVSPKSAYMETQLKYSLALRHGSF